MFSIRPMTWSMISDTLSACSSSIICYSCNLSSSSSVASVTTWWYFLNSVSMASSLLIRCIRGWSPTSNSFPLNFKIQSSNFMSEALTIPFSFSQQQPSLTSAYLAKLKPITNPFIKSDLSGSKGQKLYTRISIGKDLICTFVKFQCGSIKSVKFNPQTKAIYTQWTVRLLCKCTLSLR